MRANPLAGKARGPRGLDQQDGVKQGCRRYKLVAMAKDERFMTLHWAAVREANAPTMFPDTRGVVGSQRLVQHAYARLHISTQTGTEAHDIVDNIAGEKGLEAWERFVQRFGPGLAQPNINSMRRTLKPQ